MPIGCASNPEDEDTVLGNALIRVAAGGLCPFWPHGKRPADFTEPLRRPRARCCCWPGEHDPVTPPRYGEAIVRTLPSAPRAAGAPGQGHGLMSVGCMPRLLEEFIRTLDARALDAHCLDVLAPTPPFLDANGAGP